MTKSTYRDNKDEYHEVWSARDIEEGEELFVFYGIAYDREYEVIVCLLPCFGLIFNYYLGKYRYNIPGTRYVLKPLCNS